MHKIGIVGYGWVGKAAHKLFPQAKVYDKFGTNMFFQEEVVGAKYIPVPSYPEILKDSDVVFLAVPSPWDGEKLDCSHVEAAIKTVSNVLKEDAVIVIRSATYPGFADDMMMKYWPNIVVQPEYLGESPSHPLLEMDSRTFMILGGKPWDREKVIEAYAQTYNANIKIRQMTAYEAEVVKLTENRAVFWKLMQMQELYDACKAHGIDYYTIRDAVYGDDPRFNLWWTFVYPDKRGANSKCIPKDVYAWVQWAESSGFEFPNGKSIVEATNHLLYYNKMLLKKNKE